MADVVVSPEIVNRADFGRLLDARGLAAGVEVGVDRGHFARRLLERWKGGVCLWCVDTWAPYWEMPWDRSLDRALAVAALAHECGRVRLVQMTSEEAARVIPGWIHWAYLDAAHDYDSVRQDLRLWWARLQPEGILAGHDFDDEHEGVKRAVCEFADEVARTVYVTAGFGTAPSWYLYKTPPESLIVCAERDQ